MAIDSRYYMHPDDKAALEALKQIPGFTPLLKGFMKVFNEKQFEVLNMSSKVRLSPRQLPEYYELLPPICEKLGIEEPELYLELNRMPNAYTYGDTKVFITLTSGLIEYMTKDEIAAVIAHECGHISCHHVLYHTMGHMLLNGAAHFLGLAPLFTSALQIAFAYWQRCSEFSCDRASAICAGSSPIVVDVMMRLAGGGKDLSLNIDRELFMKQAEDYKDIVDKSTWSKILEFIILSNKDHPLTAVRAYEITKWCDTDAFRNLISPDADRILQGFAEDGRAERAAGVRCPFCGAAIEENWAFCKGCGAKLKDKEEKAAEEDDTDTEE